MDAKSLITIDNGNTNPSVGKFVGGKLSVVIPFKQFNLNLVETTKTQFIISDVGKKDGKLDKLNNKLIRPSSFKEDNENRPVQESSVVRSVRNRKTC